MTNHVSTLAIDFQAFTLSHNDFQAFTLSHNAIGPFMTVFTSTAMTLKTVELFCFLTTVIGKTRETTAMPSGLGRWCKFSTIGKTDTCAAGVKSPFQKRCYQQVRHSKGAVIRR